MPQIAQVVIKPFEQLRTAWASLLRGEVDMVTDVPPDAVQFIKNDDVDVVSYSRPFQYLVAFNSRRPLFSSPVVRRALNYAVDRQLVIDRVLQGRGLPSTGPLWPKHWAYDSSIPPYTFDPALAMSLLDGAGLRADSQKGLTRRAAALHVPDPGQLQPERARGAGRSKTALQHWRGHAVRGRAYRGVRYACAGRPFRGNADRHA